MIYGPLCTEFNSNDFIDWFIWYSASSLFEEVYVGMDMPNRLLLKLLANAIDILEILAVFIFKKERWWCQCNWCIHSWSKRHPEIILIQMLYLFKGIIRIKVCMINKQFWNCFSSNSFIKGVNSLNCFSSY